MANKKRFKLPPTKPGLANFQVMSGQGYSPHSIGKLGGPEDEDPWGGKTSNKYKFAH